MPVKTTPNLVTWTALQTGMLVPHVQGPPGTAKTASFFAFCRATARKPYVLIGSLREPADIGGYPYPVKVEKTSALGIDVYMKMVSPEWAYNMHDGAKWAFMLDECTSVAPAVQSAMLRVMAEKVVGETPLPPDTWMMAASNPSGIAANGQDIEPPLANRMMHLPWESDTNAWDTGIAQGFQPNGDGVTMQWDFPAPSFVTLPSNWWTVSGHYGGLVATFRKTRPSLFETDEDKLNKDRTTASGAYPTYRSWTNAVTAMSALDAIDAEPVLRYKALAACVGEPAMIEYRKWEQELDLPDPEHMLAAMEQFHANGEDEPGLEKIVRSAFAIEAAENQAVAGKNRKPPKRCDQLSAILNSVWNRVTVHSTPATHRRRTENALRIVMAVFDTGIGRELSVIGSRHGFNNVKPEYDMPQRFVDEAYPLLVKSGMLKAIN